MEQVKLFNVKIHNITWNQALAFINESVKAKENRYIVTPNVNRVVTCQKDPLLMKIYNQADLSINDSEYLLWASKILGKPLKAKIPGSDITPVICEEAVNHGWGLFFFGAGPGVAEKAKRNLMREYPKLRVLGTYSPPYGFEKEEKENQKAIEKIRTHNPEILIVGLGSPKEEKWIYRNKYRLQVPLSIGVGATLDFLAGHVRRAPKWMTNHGLEWFWRFLQEPRRLWKRYFIRDLAFFPLIVREVFTNIKNSK